MFDRNDSSSNHTAHLLRTMDPLAITWFSSSCEYFPAPFFLQLTKEQEKAGCVSTSLLNLRRRELWSNLIHSQAVFPPAVSRTTQTLAGMKLGEDSTGHQRMAIKRWTWLDPAAVVRCGHSTPSKPCRASTQSQEPVVSWINSPCTSVCWAGTDGRAF